MDKELRVFCLTGPTASGKTDVALALAERFDAEIVSMDSALVYRGMDIGTDKPDVRTRQHVAHHLIDIREPEETYSAGAFATDAASAIRAITARGRMALVVGGTMLYLRALREGLADLPERDADLRARIDAEARDRGWQALHTELARVDPVAAARIEPTDRQRIQRALEVFRLAGRPLSELQAAAGAQAGIRMPTVALVPADRDWLKQRVERRFDAMVAAGFVNEVKALRARPGLSAETPSMRSVGYRQIWAFLSGACDWEVARARAIAATRQLAKRQLTWLRSDAGVRTLASEDPGLLKRVCDEIEGRLAL